jgi:ATP-dependent Clp protease ATP-binding subunit ClpB
VGKTELAKSLADYLFNDENAMVRIDMSEYQERHAVSRLIGAPPGYVGYDEGGQLTEAVRRRPYSVVLLDEIEKAHPDVFNILLQVLDDGRLTDNKGRTANFKNTIIIMTSNIGAHLIQDNFQGINEFNEFDIVEDTREQLMDLLKKTIRPEFLNRIDEVVMFRPLGKAEVRKIVDFMLKDVQKRLIDLGIQLEATPEVKDFLGELGYDPQFGARPLKRLIQRRILNELSKEILAGNIQRDSVVAVTLDKNNDIRFESIQEVEV